MPRSRSASLQDNDEVSSNKPVLNDLLCYVFSAMRRFSFDDISGKVVKFYLPGCINAAKQLLWENFSSLLPPLVSRQDTAKRKASEAEVDDIMMALKLIDSKSKGDDLVLFVAKDPFNMPSNSLTDQLPQRMMAFESEMSPLKSVILNMARRPVTQRDSWYDSGKSFWDISEQEYSSLPVLKDPLLESAGGDDITSVKQSASSASGAGSAAQRPVAAAASYAKAVGTDQEVDSDGFQTVKGPKWKKAHKTKVQAAPPAEKNSQPPLSRRPPCISGTKLNTTFRSGPRRANIFVFRVHNDFDASHVTDHLQNGHVNVLNIEKKSKDDAAAKSFHVLIESDNLKEVFEPSFWPKGVCCKKYYTKNNGSK